MKKVTMTFVVSDETANEALQEMGWGEMGNAANILNASCDESDYDVRDMDRVVFVVKKDNNAELHNRFILSVRKNGKCIEAPRFMFLDEALKEVADYLEEFDENETTIEVKI